MSISDNSAVTIGCVSMTHLGLVHAAAFADKGFNVVGYDASDRLIAQLKTYKLPVSEPQLDALVAEHSDRLTFTNELSDIHSCDVVFISCDVPTDDKGNSDLTTIHDLISTVTPYLADQACLVILSQVPPSFTRQLAFSAHTVFYQVETLIFGRAVDRAVNPERYIVGMTSPELPLPKDYQQLLASFNCPILKMRYESAELAKISINMFLVSSVSTTNTIAELCEQIGADWNEIAPALRLDKRIGPYAYLTPGLGISGGNLERDLNTITKFGQAHHTDVGVVDAWLHNSVRRKNWVYEQLQACVLNNLEDPLICILGIAYKPNTHSIKNSPSVELIDKLKNCCINTHDPVVTYTNSNTQQKTTVQAAIEQADVVIIMTPWAEYSSLSIAQLKKQMNGNVIIDPFHVLSMDAADAIEGIEYRSLGQAPVLEVECQSN
ncbi:MAG: hypothetical protein COB66_01525 [Coxiella sp. (in: Bacteria)]|nr:MAG: hypothetical protein COB66_01525 [Coxiella sp. (in: g-proteobacteria)]